ncbi:MAG: substrate-binding domain-containing protein [Lentisphaeraceae bacterium]|nr:substrate-binding domain-containing protein [Lentisphaeraceae bacterium]
MLKIAIGIDLDWPFEHHYDVIRGILDYGKKESWNCSTQSWLEVADTIEDIPGNFDGIIARTSPALAKYCQEKEIPLINVWTNSPVKDIPLVRTDLQNDVRIMVDYFISRGFHNITFISRLDDVSTKLMAKTFFERLEEKGIETNDDMHLALIKPEFKQGWLDFENSLGNWISKQQLPLAICVGNHLYARYIIEWCKHNELMVPDDVAVLSAMGNELICEKLEPSISHIRNRFVEMGFTAAQNLHKMINGEKIEQVHIIPTGELIEKRSTDVEPVEDRTIARALRFIWDNSSFPIQVIDVSSAVDLSRRSLERRFKKHLNRTINEEIMRSRIERAKKLFTNTDKTIREVAEESGFSSSHRLSQVFRKYLGMTVKEFRESKR